MKSLDFYNLIRDSFPFTPTLKQDIVLQNLSNFVLDKSNDKIFLLKGYAGTGKTTLIASLEKNLWKIKKSSVLLAPTGRAAKVISNYSSNEAQTIHKKIYVPRTDKNGKTSFVLGLNKHKNSIFIVDESSMISGKSNHYNLFGSGVLLDDLIQYVYSGFQCKILFIGDTAQLPPIEYNLSPALNVDFLESNFKKNVIQFELDEVVRQEQNSGILYNATLLRSAISLNNLKSFKFELDQYVDIVKLNDGQDILDELNDSYSIHGNDETTFIVRSNKRANLYNQQIRSRVLFKDHEIASGDYLMIVKNNYFWLKPSSEAGFIANGDIIEILEIYNIKDLYEFRFAEVKIRLVDYPNMKPVDTVIMLNTLSLETASLSYTESNRLYQNILLDYEHEKSSYKKFLAIKKNKYLNALQVKFAYAITCHKSQGGQWNNVFVEKPYLPNGIDEDYLRWLYTAITRAKKKLFLIGFEMDFFED